MLVQVYGRPMCDACEALTNFLDFKGVYYEYNNVEYIDFTEVSRVIASRRDPNNRTLPILFVDGRELEGNDEITKFFNRASPAPTTGLGARNVSEEGRNIEGADSDYQPGLGSSRHAPQE